MATVYKQSNGSYVCEFYVDKKRTKVRLGKCRKDVAATVQRCIGDLITSNKLQEQPSEPTRKWLKEIDAKLHSKLASLGLTQHREITTLGPFTQNYIDGRTDATDATKRKFRVTRQYLVDKFGEDKDIAAVTEADADDFRVYLLGQQTSRLSADTMGENTVRKHCQIAGQFFNRAVKMRLIDRNPFQSLPSTVQRNPTRDYFISQDDMVRLLDACPDTQWRLLFALPRYAGLRCPTEVLALTWDDIDWQREEMTIHAAKTKRYIGKGQRIVPIFADLLPILRDAQELAEDGSSHVITRYRDNSTNLRTQAHRIIKRAGLQPWPKCFQNLRASLATELVQFLPLHQAAEWTGHSIQTMQKFYLQITPEHREAARKRKQMLLEKEHTSAGRKEGRLSQDMAGNGDSAKALILELSISNLACPNLTMGDEGLYSSPETLGNAQVLQQRGAKRGAVKICTDLPTLAVDLATQLSSEHRQQLGQLLQVGQCHE